MLADGTTAMIWPLRAVLTQTAFLQQYPRWTGMRRIPTRPTLPWIYKTRPQNGQTSFGRVDRAPIAVTRPTRPTRPTVVHRLFPTTPTRYYVISGVTRDSTGAALGLCLVELIETATDIGRDRQTSDAAGNFSFNTAERGKTYYLVAYKPGSPDVAGTTLNTLQGVYA